MAVNPGVSLNAPARIATLGAAPTVARRVETLRAVRQDAQALKKAPTAQFSLPGLAGILDMLLNGWSSPAPKPRGTEFVVSSFNVLGSSHTAPGGNKPGMDPGTVRIRRAVELLRAHKVDVAGFQEFQVDQVKEFNKVAGKQYGVYPGLSLGKGPNVNSIVWRKDTWELVKADTIAIPYFDGKPVKMPVVRLRHKKTGQEAYFSNFHNPASTRWHPGNERWRDVATEKEIALVNRLKQQTGLPVFVLGDMNEREEYYDKMTKGAPMVSADAGPKGKRPRKMGIDWIFGSKGVKFSDYTRDRSALVQKTSDHPMIVSKARIDA